MQAMVSSADLNIDRPRELSVRYIFEDNHNWDVFLHLNRASVRDVEIEEVEKMLSCKDADRGFFLWYCESCEEDVVVHFGCNSRLCSSCGKNYTDKWAKSLSRAMFEVPHRHIVLSISDLLWPYVRQYRVLHKVLMDSAIQALNDTMSYCLRKQVLVGAIVVLHPFSRDLSFKPHIHVLVTEGGFDGKGNFVHKRFIPARPLRMTWQYQVLTKFKKALPKTREIARLIDYLFKRYDGFYAYLPEESRIVTKRDIARYVARYVRHPAIANTRICGYDGKTVSFWYKDNKEVKHYRTMEVLGFISALVQHVPDRQFKMIRYYGSYCRKWKKKYAHYAGQRSIAQTTLMKFSGERVQRCPFCGDKMKFVLYWPKGPPENEKFLDKIEDWNYLSLRQSHQ